MAPPSALAIASGAVMRLSREEASYHTELAAQEAKAKALEDQIKSGGDTDDANAEFMLRQQVSRAGPAPRPSPAPLLSLSSPLPGADGLRMRPREVMACTRPLVSCSSRSRCCFTKADGREGQRLAIEQTKAVFEPLRRQVAEARARLEEQMEASEGGANVSVADVEQARAVLAQTKSP